MSDNEKKDYCLSMANTILQTLFWSIDIPVFLSWGVSERKACFYKDMPSLMLKVNGRIHKGQVIVSYDEGRDVYNVYLLKNNVQIQSFECIYADQLGIFIDSKIEKPENQNDEEYHAMAKADFVRLCL